MGNNPPKTVLDELCSWNPSLVSVKEKMGNFAVPRNQRAIGTTLVFLWALFLCACGGGSTPSNAQPGGVASVTVSPSSAAINVGQTQQFTAVAKDSNGNVINGASFTWSSDTTSVATVNSNGLATTVAQGTAHITATSSGVNGTATLTVNPAGPTVASVTVTPAAATINIGQTQQFTAVAKDANGNVITEASFTWNSDATSVATVNSNGLATAVTGGTAHITATSGGVNGSATLLVASVASVTVSPATATITVGQRQQFTAVAKDSGGNVINGVTFIWSSDVTSVATVDTNGLATGVSQGTAHISATASGITGSGTLTVNPQVGGNAIPASFFGFTINNPCSIANTKPDGTNCNNSESHNFPGLPLTWSRSLGENYIKWNDIVQCDPTGTVCPLPGSGCSKDGVGANGSPCPSSQLVANCAPKAKAADDPTNCAYLWQTFDFYAARFNAHSTDFMYDAYFTPDYLSVRGSRCTGNGQADFGADPTCIAPADSCGGGKGFSWGCDPPFDIDATPGSGKADGTDQHFKWFVSAFMKHLQQNAEHIRYWEVWNEPNVCKEWNHGDQANVDCTKQNPGGGPSVGTAAQLVRMARDARDIIPTFDPNVLISSPALVGIAGSVNQAYMNKILTQGGSVFDWIGFHGYYATGSGGCPSNCPIPENWLAQWNAVVKVMNATGQSSKPAINTEYSWGAATNVVDPDMRAAQAARLFLLQESYYPALARESWYAEDFPIKTGGGSGEFWASGATHVADSCTVVDPAQGGFICPAGLAMNQIFKWTLGATFSGACTCSGPNCSPAPAVGVFQCAITRPGGYAGLFVWDSSATTFPCQNAPCGNTTFTIPPGYTSDWQDLNGNVTQLGGNSTVTIGAKPILIETVP